MSDRTVWTDGFMSVVMRDGYVYCGNPGRMSAAEARALAAGLLMAADQNDEGLPKEP